MHRFGAFPSTVLIAHRPLTVCKCIYHWGLVKLCRFRSVTVNCDLKKVPACVMRILHKSPYAFAIKCWFNDFYFELFDGIFRLCHIHMELSSVTSMNSHIHLTLLRPLIPIWHRNWYRVPAMNPLASISTAFMIQHNFEIFIYPGFILVAMFHPGFIWLW